MCIHHRKVMRHWKPDERRLTCAFANAGWLQRARGQPCPPSHANCFAWQKPPSQHSPSLLGPFHLRRQTAGIREIARSRWGHLLWLAHPSIVSLSHVTYSCFPVWQHFKTVLSVLCETQKEEEGKKGEEKLTRCLFTQAQILWKSRHHEKNQIMRQQKQSNPPPTRSGLAPLRLPSPHFPLENTQGPSEVIRRRDFTSRNLCKESARTKGHLQFYKMADVMLLLKNEDLPYWVGEEKTRQEGKNREKSCWPGLRQIDSSIDFPVTVTVHPSLLWLHWPISEKKKPSIID